MCPSPWDTKNMLKDVTACIISNILATINHWQNLVICSNYLWPLLSRKCFVLILDVPLLLVEILSSWDPHTFTDAFTIFPSHTSLRAHESYFALWPIHFLDINLADLEYPAIENVVQFHSCTCMGYFPEW